jgi:hypothetical protein
MVTRTVGEHATEERLDVFEGRAREAIFSELRDFLHRTLAVYRAEVTQPGSPEMSLNVKTPDVTVARLYAPRQRSELLAIFFAFNHLSEIAFRIGRTLMTVFVVLLDRVQDSYNSTTARSALADLELAG